MCRPPCLAALNVAVAYGSVASCLGPQAMLDHELWADNSLSDLEPDACTLRETARKLNVPKSVLVYLYAEHVKEGDQVPKSRLTQMDRCS